MREESPQQIADRQLMARVVGGDQAAFAQLYDRLSGPLYSLGLKMLGDAAEAEDAVQEAFVQIWRRAPTYDASLSSVFSWAVHITRCKIIDYLRARGRRLKVIAPADDDLAAELPDASSGGDAADALSRSEGASHIRRVLRDLPAEQRQAVEMAFLCDLSHHEIASRLSQPLGTIKARIRRALLKLRDSLDRVL